MDQHRVPAQSRGKTKRATMSTPVWPTPLKPLIDVYGNFLGGPSVRVTPARHALRARRQLPRALKCRRATMTAVPQRNDSYTKAGRCDTLFRHTSSQTRLLSQSERGPTHLANARAAGPVQALLRATSLSLRDGCVLEAGSRCSLEAVESGPLS